ncbi:MAG: hypothetical protein H6673_01055 [Anaerolineales bacterium]|nr:hypothetical protein [Anaerolineales bacterium]
MSLLPGVWPSSIRGINDLPLEQKRAIYQTLVPDWVFSRFGLHEDDVQTHCPTGSRAMEISISVPDFSDPILYLNMADSFLGQLMVLLVVMNDPNSDRYNIDTLPDGSQTYLGTSSRNLPEEIRAMEAGLSPGQVHQGIRGFRHSVPVFERFIEQMHHDLFLIEPLSYHNAIIFERYGFGYTVGRKEMERIHREFQPNGDLNKLLDGSTPFRYPDAWRSIRGRSWAIHDGVLGHPFTGFHMYKRIYHNAGISTFPDAEW